MSGQPLSRRFLIQSTKPHSLCCGQCIGKVHQILYGVCSSLPYSQVALGNSPHFFMDMLNLPTVVHKRLRRVYANLDKSKPVGLCWWVGKWRCSWVVIDSPSLVYFSVIHWVALTWSSCMVFLKRSIAAGTIVCLNLSHQCPGEDSKICHCNKFFLIQSTFTDWNVLSSVASSAGWMPDRIGRNSVSVGHGHIVTMCIVLLRHLSIRLVCMLLHHVGTQYSSGA